MYRRRVFYETLKMEGFKKTRGKLPISRRYDLLPLLPSGPDGIQRELAVWNLPPEFER